MVEVAQDTMETNLTVVANLQDTVEPDTTAEEILDMTEPNLTIAERLQDKMEPNLLATHKASAKPPNEELRTENEPDGEFRTKPLDERATIDLWPNEAPPGGGA